MLKLYLPEPDSEQFNDMVARRTDLLVSDLGVTEIVSALARRAREGAISRSTLERARRAVIQGLDNGLYRRVELTRDVHRRAEHLLVHLTDQLRAADALHLALATSAGALSMASFDRRLAGAARAVGLEIYPEPR